MNLELLIIGSILATLLMSYGLGLILGHGKTDLANKILRQEFKLMWKFSCWLLWLLTQAMSDLLGYLAKKANPPKKKTP